MTQPLRLLNLFLVAGLTVATFGPAAPAQASHTPNPVTVAIPGTLQSELGCSGDWQPDCDKTFLTYDAEDDVWQGTFSVQPNDDQDKNGPRYKAALNGNWGENYGAHAQQNGPDIPLVVAEPTQVKFYYDHKTHWVTDNYNTPIVTVVGDFQTQFGCAENDDPACLRSWLQDPDGDGVLAFTTTALKAGTYTARAALREQLAEVYGGPDGGPVVFTVRADGDEIYFGFDPVKQELLVSAAGAPRGSLATAKAHWVTREALLWNVVGSPRYTYTLHYDANGAMALTPAGVVGGQAIPLTWAREGPGGDVFKQFPHLAGYTTLKLADADLDKVPEILKGQIIVTALDSDGRLVDATRPQIPGVLDDLYDYDGPLGVTLGDGRPALYVWAPTARSVSLHLYDSSTTPVDVTVPLALDPATGVWGVVGPPDWNDKFYLYEVEVYVPATGKVERNLVTDPYSLSLSMNSARSQIVDLDDPAFKPDGWDVLQKPPLEAPEDSVIYELHVRDFSVNDASVPPDLRGTFLAFTVLDSQGTKHLRALAEAGLTHIHLLPIFDIASIDEDKSTWKSADEALLATYPGDSDRQAATVGALRDEDAFNWGYDPYHYTVPDGAYATNPDGPARIREFRALVQALNGLGLRVVMDVVYNHTNASGQAEKSVLDKIVPGYYYRLNLDGQVEKSTCCENTASEHRMMEKLMVDSVLTWATAYKVDGFRFDLMGHHMLSNMRAVRAALDALTPDQGGVDGRAIHIYGEGWDFGEVADNARGQNAAQLNIGGTGLGVFNDRLRDGARGGSPFSDPREQGFLTGLFLQSNAVEARDPDAQRARLLEYTDWIRIGLAGNLRDYRLVDRTGETTTGQRVFYNGAPAGYTLDPQENVIYVSAHDNETLFDAVQWKAAEAVSLADRVRMHDLGLSLVALAQGVPFFQAGDELLRSKSLDRNSYNSGDWFNKLDFTGQTNNWAVGLPIEGRDRWDLMRPLLANPALKPSPADIGAARAHFLELLRLRQSSRLFRLRSADEIDQHLTFLNTGVNQVPGLIVMSLTDVADVDLDPNYEQIVVLFNANAGRVDFTEVGLKGLALHLHPLQQQSEDRVMRGASFDPATGTFAIPGRTAVVFVREEAVAAAAPTVNPPPAPTASPVTPSALSSPTATAAPVSPTQAPTATRAPTPQPLPSPASATPTGLAWALAIAMIGVLVAIYLMARAARHR